MYPLAGCGDQHDGGPSIAWYNLYVNTIDNPVRTVEARKRDRFPLAVLAAVYSLSILLPMPGAGGRILGLPTICAFNHLTGLPCPGCGLTRAFVSIAHGHLVDAVHWHALSPALFLLGLALLVEYASRVFAGKSILRLSSTWNSRAGWTAAAIFIGFGVARAVYFAANHLRF